MKIRKTNLFILLCTFLTVIGCSKNASDIPLKDIESHRIYQDENGIKNVKYEYQKLLEKHPNSEIAYYLLARCEESNQKSLEYLYKSLEINPEFYYSFVSLGVIFMKQNNFVQSKAFLERAIEIDDKDFLAYQNLYTLNIKEGRKKGSFKTYYYRDALSALKKASIANESYNRLKEQDNEYYVKMITALENELSEIRNAKKAQSQKRTQSIKRIEQEQICSKYSHETFLRERLDNLGYMVLSIQLNSNSDCSYQWLVQTIDKYGIDRFCAVNTNFVSGEIEVTNVKCN